MSEFPSVELLVSSNSLSNRVNRGIERVDRDTCISYIIKPFTRTNEIKTGRGTILYTRTNEERIRGTNARDLSLYLLE